MSTNFICVRRPNKDIYYFNTNKINNICIQKINTDLFLITFFGDVINSDREEAISFKVSNLCRRRLERVLVDQHQPSDLYLEAIDLSED